MAIWSEGWFEEIPSFKTEDEKDLEKEYKRRLDAQQDYLSRVHCLQRELDDAKRIFEENSRWLENNSPPCKVNVNPAGQHYSNTDFRIVRPEVAVKNDLEQMDKEFEMMTGKDTLK